MALPVEKIEEVAPSTIRRFSEADLTTHGAWILKRLTQKYPHLNERQIVTYLRGMFTRNDCLFLYQDNAVACAEIVTNTLEPKPIVQERFVWAKNPENVLHVNAAARFYANFFDWAKALRADRIVLSNSTDVPPDKIKDHLGRLQTVQMMFARV